MHNNPLSESSTDQKLVFIYEYAGFSLDNENALADWIIKVAHSKERTIECIEYVFCDDPYLLSLNKKHLNHNYLTDILTFPLQSSPIEANIFISIDRVRENAITYKVGFEDELHRVMIHGVLHLLGLEDDNEESKNKMREEENRCLEERGFI